MVGVLSDCNFHVFKDPCTPGKWTKEKMSHAMCFFPLVGAIEGCFFRALALYCSAISSICGNEISLGVGHPLSCNRGIHMDGFMDTMDAVHSYGDRTKKLEILKIPI